jgi:hypothetical protein
VIDVIRSEWIKFRSVRSTLVLVLAAGMLVVVVAFFAARSEQQDTNRFICRTANPGTITVDGPDGGGQVTLSEACTTNLGDLTVGIPFALFLFGALGVQIIGQEYRFNTIRPTFTAVPRRMRVLVAKLVVVSAACAVITVAMLALCALIGSVMVDDFQIDGLDHRVIWGTILFNVGWTAMGMGVGAILRQPVAGIVVLLMEAFVVENIVRAVIKGSGEWMPFINGIQMTIREAEDSGQIRSVTAGGVYFFVVAAIVWGIGAALADRRDA